MLKYKSKPGDHIDQCARGASELAFKHGRNVTFEFNGVNCFCKHDHTIEENRVACRASLGMPAKDPPFHPQSALDALERWDAGQTVFTIEMGGFGPSYEQAIQILVFEIIRDEASNPLPVTKDEQSKWGDGTVSRVDKIYGFSGAQVGAAKQVAYRAIRDGWGEMLESAPEDRKIQVSKFFPQTPSTMTNE